MKNLLNVEIKNKMEKINKFKLFVSNFTNCYKFQDIYVSDNEEWSVLRFNPLYHIIIDSEHVIIRCNSGMVGSDWSKSFKKDELSQIVNFIAEKLNKFPIN